MADRALSRYAAVEQPAGVGVAPLVAFLRLLAGSQPEDRFFEIRAISRDRVQRSFVAAARPALAAARIREGTGSGDVYLGVALRTTNRFGGKQAIDGSHLAFIECDSATAADAVRSFACPPTMLIASGTPGHLHAYWQLRHQYLNAQIERANRQLALHLGGDLASVDIARVLRPPGTLNHKHQPSAPVELVSHRPAVRYSLAELTAGLPVPRPAIPQVGATRRRLSVAADPLDGRLRDIETAEYVRALTGRTADRSGKISCPFHELSGRRAVSDGVSPARSFDDASLNDGGAGQERTESAVSGRAAACWDLLRLVPPPVYFERLTGVRVGRSGKVRCLFHDDRVPSLHVFREPGRGWYCFGCGRGGSIYDLAALLSGRSTRGSDFRELRRELEALLL